MPQISKKHKNLALRAIFGLSCGLLGVVSGWTLGQSTPPVKFSVSPERVAGEIIISPEGVKLKGDSQMVLWPERGVASRSGETLLGAGENGSLFGETFDIAIRYEALPSTKSAVSPLDTQNEVSGEILASKNGTKYYYADCGTVSRIKQENIVSFITVQEAEAAGYEPSACVLGR